MRLKGGILVPLFAAICIVNGGGNEKEVKSSMPKPYYRIILIVLTVACGVSTVYVTPRAPRNATDWELLIIQSMGAWFIISATAGWVLYVNDWLRTSLLVAATPLLLVTPFIVLSLLHLL
jgi:hypothetical protein